MGNLQPAERCLLTDLRTGVLLFACYQTAIGMLLLVYSLYLIISSFYWGMIPSAVLYILVGSVGLSATTNRHAVLYYAPAVIRAADIYFVLTAGMCIADVFISAWQIAYVATAYSNCTKTLSPTACESELFTLIIVVVWKCLTMAVLFSACYFTWSYQARLKDFKPVMSGQEHVEAPHFMTAPVPQPDQPFNPYYPSSGVYYLPGHQPTANPLSVLPGPLASTAAGSTGGSADTTATPTNKAPADVGRNGE